MMEKYKHSISIVFPAYNEEDNITSTIESSLKFAKKHFKNFEIIVVNDGSVDKTLERAKAAARASKRIRIINHSKNLGYGAAVWRGLRAAKHELIFFSDSDQQFDIRELKRLIAKIDKYDVVIGYRAKRQDRFMRKLNALGWKLLLRILLDLDIHDIDCAFKLFKRKVIQKVKVESIGATFSAELIYRINELGYSIYEIPVRHFPRTLGSPTGAKPSVIVKAFKELIVFNRKRKKNQAKFFINCGGHSHARLERFLAIF